MARPRSMLTFVRAVAGPESSRTGSRTLGSPGTARDWIAGHSMYAEMASKLWS
ncbi:hypothetical protein ACVWW1_004520 [Bradyrhizobium sp. JR3.5]